MLNMIEQEITANLKGRDFLDLEDYTPDELRYLIDFAIHLKRKQQAGEVFRIRSKGRHWG